MRSIFCSHAEYVYCSSAGSRPSPIPLSHNLCSSTEISISLLGEGSRGRSTLHPLFFSLSPLRPRDCHPPSPPFLLFSSPPDKSIITLPLFFPVTVCVFLFSALRPNPLPPLYCQDKSLRAQKVDRCIPHAP